MKAQTQLQNLFFVYLLMRLRFSNLRAGGKAASDSGWTGRRKIG